MRPLDECLLRLIRKGDLDAEDHALLHQSIREDPLSEEVFSIAPDRTEQALEERLDFFHLTGHLLPECRVTVNGREVKARILLSELWRFYAPLCLLLVRFARNNRAPRSLFGLAGPPGSGKSIAAALLTTLINDFVDPQKMGAAVCSLDGFHLPNDRLDSILVDGPNGTRRPLRWEKGSPRTFDVEQFVARLDALRTGQTVQLPVYDRRIHSPVPDAQTVGPATRIIFVEGNYLLLDRGPWYAIAPLLDLKCFVLIPRSALRGAIIVRHVRGGRTKEDAKRHFTEVDLPNYETTLQTMPHADLILKRDALQRLVGLQWNDQKITEAPDHLTEPEESELVD